jgi:hypothetical protein
MDIKKILVKPAEGRRVLHPRSFLPVPAEGMKVNANESYWLRRIKDGDVIIVGQSYSAPAESEGDE